ncbi:MAG: helix-turn-helix domain-containing protein [Brevundimonas sp.]
MLPWRRVDLQGRRSLALGPRKKIDPDKWPEVYFFVQAFKAARKRAKITQRTISDMTGVNQSYISGLEKHFANPSLEVMAVLARAVGKSLGELLPPAQSFPLQGRWVVGPFTGVEYVNEPDDDGPDGMESDALETRQ